MTLWSAGGEVRPAGACPPCHERDESFKSEILLNLFWCLVGNSDCAGSRVMQLGWNRGKGEVCTSVWLLWTDKVEI